MTQLKSGLKRAEEEEEEKVICLAVAAALFTQRKTTYGTGGNKNVKTEWKT